MVDEKKLEVNKTEEVKKPDIIEDNVAVLKANLKDTLESLDGITKKYEELDKKYQQARDFIEDGTKSGLISDIKRKTSIPEGILIRKTVDELKEILKIADASKVAFKSTTPYFDEKKRPTLDGMFESFAKATWRKNP